MADWKRSVPLLFLPLADWRPEPVVRSLRKRHSFFEFSLCLSRACLGKCCCILYKNGIAKMAFLYQFAFHRWMVPQIAATVDGSGGTNGRTKSVFLFNFCFVVACVPPRSSKKEEMASQKRRVLFCFLFFCFVLCAAHITAVICDVISALENGTFFEFSLCLSRACLGKMLIFIYKWLKSAVFLPYPLRNAGHAGQLPCRKRNLFFECFPYVRPEPVLAT
jgi:hypothetical protein